MDTFEKIEKFLASKEQDVETAAELLRDIAMEKKAPRTLGLSRRVGTRPKRQMLPHIVRELARCLRNYKPKDKDSAPVAKASAPVAAKKQPSAPAKDEYVAPPVVKMFSDEEYDNLPQVVKDFSTENIKLQRIRGKAKHGLEEAKDDETRRQIAESIAEMTEQIDSNFAALKYYKEHGQLPEAPTTEGKELTLAEAIKERANASSRRSKAKSAAAKAKTKATKEKNEAKFAEEDKEILLLDELIAKLQQEADESIQDNPEN